MWTRQGWWKIDVENGNVRTVECNRDTLAFNYVVVYERGVDRRKGKRVVDEECKPSPTTMWSIFPDDIVARKFW